jgi:hypothetical protein
MRALTPAFLKIVNKISINFELTKARISKLAEISWKKGINSAKEWSYKVLQEDQKD